jgi:carboxyl-terminal processing protease
MVGETTFGKGLVQTIVPLRNVRGYAIALTTARYYTPSGRSIQRDYGSTALEDYVAPRDRKSCEEGVGEAKLTDAGRKVFGGDGITPDICVEPDTANKVVAHLVSRQAFLLFSRGFAANEVTGGAASIAGAGTRSEVKNENVRNITRDFEVDARVIADFKAFVKAKGLGVSAEDIEANKEQVGRLIQEETLRQVFGEGEARRKSMAWDPQIRRALEAVAKAELLLKDPKRYVAMRESDDKVALRR